MSYNDLTEELEDLIIQRLRSLPRAERRRVLDGALSIYSHTSSIVAFRNGGPVALVHERTGRAFSLGGPPAELLADDTVPMPQIPHLDDLLDDRGDSPAQHGNTRRSTFAAHYPTTQSSGASSGRRQNSSTYNVRETDGLAVATTVMEGAAGNPRTSITEAVKMPGIERKRRESSGYDYTETYNPAGFSSYFTETLGPSGSSSHHTEARHPTWPFDFGTHSRGPGESASYYTQTRSPDDSSDYSSEGYEPSDTGDHHRAQGHGHDRSFQGGSSFSGFRTETRAPGGSSGHYTPPPQSNFHSRRHTFSPREASPPRSQTQAYPRAPPANETQADRFERLQDTPYGYYDILGVSRHATQAEIRKAYRKLSLEHHPDRNPNDKEGSERRFSAINAAHELLSNEGHRKRYDEQFGRTH
ncbi:putative chaperone protein [Botryosphaeria dothidea]|uniref:Chaperone protein n=1 Tax=Botryosphaeria dothidea TaxID=55169 RepID=A0A8H4IME0_9PEZI|nr:putative chaperone protein [Botryosphaeria dothidea]